MQYQNKQTKLNWLIALIELLIRIKYKVKKVGHLVKYTL